MIERLRRLLAAPELAERLRRLAADAPPTTPLSLGLDLGPLDEDWLALLPNHASYWYRARPAAGEFRLGLGHAFQVGSQGESRFAALDNAWQGFCRAWRHDGPGIPQAFAGFAFAPETTAVLPNALLAVPALLLECLGGRGYAILSTAAERCPQAVADWLTLLRLAPAACEGQLLPSPPDELPARAWQARVGAALRSIDEGPLTKLVLSRCRQFTATRPFAPGAILGRLLAQQPDSLIYAHGQGQSCFLGATPECLVAVNGRQVVADALAGTAWPGSPDLAWEKNRREQGLVVAAVEAALAPHCLAPPSRETAQPLTAGHLTHLRSRISGQLRAESSLWQLAGALHPTPAVGGYPVVAACRWLAEHGDQRHGWYSGGIGQFGIDGDGEFSVALRCALLEGKQAILQAGAGIVAGSDPAQEQAEIDAKLATLRTALAAMPTARSAAG